MDATHTLDPNETRAEHATELLPLRVRRHATEQPDRVVLGFLDESVSIQQSWTFGELDQRARSIAARLQRAGLTGQPAVVAYPSGLEFVAAFCGCLYAGVIAVPACLPRSHGIDERLSTIVGDSGARLVLTGRRHQPLIEQQLQSRSVAVLASDDMADESEAWRPVACEPDQVAFLQYTSGSTRAPLGVMISHANLAANLQALHETLRTHAGSVGISWLPLFHDMGLIAGALEPLWVGYRALLMAPATFVQSPLRWLRAFTAYRGTIGGGPNFGYQACVDAARSGGVADLDLSTWDMAWNGAEPVRASTLQEFRDTFGPARFRSTSLTPSFGLAEATLLVTANNGTVSPVEVSVDDAELRNDRIRTVDRDDPHGKCLVGAGRPPRGTEVRIVEPETRAEADGDRVGEIWVRGDGVGQGYWNKADETRATFGARLSSGEGPFLRTGDLGFVHHGELFVVGRRKDVIVIRGVNYYPQDLELTVASSHPALRADATAAFAIEDGASVRLVVVQEIRRDARRTLDADEVFVAIRRAVAREHQLPLSGIVLLKPFGLPKTSSGKLQRAGCRSALQNQALPALHEWWAPATTVAPIDFTGEPLSQPGVLERQLVAWLERECSLTGLTWKTPLMELGIDSLKGVELGNALSAAFNHSFSATLLIDHPNVEALADLIREEVLGIKPAAPAAPLRVGPSAPAISAAEIAALDPDALDALLESSIAAVLDSENRP